MTIRLPRLTGRQEFYLVFWSSLLNFCCGFVLLFARPTVAILGGGVLIAIALYGWATTPKRSA